MESIDPHSGRRAFAAGNPRTPDQFESFNIAMHMCDWCGADHPVAQLCHARPRWSRRGFVALLGMGFVGAFLPGQLGSSQALSFNVGPSETVFTYDAHTIRRWQEAAIKLAPKCPWIITPEQIEQMSVDDPWHVFYQRESRDVDATIQRMKDAVART